MARRVPRELPADVEEVRVRIDSWRAGCRKRSPIPKEFWAAAVALAQTHGVNPVSCALRLSYDALRCRLVEASVAPVEERAAPPGFVELEPMAATGPAEAEGPVVEVTDSDGVRLVVRLPRGAEVDVPALAAAFRRGCR